MNIYDIVMYCPDENFLYNWETPYTKGIGGGKTSLIRISHALGAFGHRVAFYGNFDREGLYNGVQHLDFRKATEIKCDVLIAASSQGNPDLSALAGIAINARLIGISIHGLPKPRGLDMIPYDYIYSPSHFLKGYAVENWGIAPDKIVVCNRAIDEPAFFEAERLSISRDPFGIVYFGHPDKGLDVAVEIVKSLRQRDSRFYLDIYGGYQLHGNNLREICEEEGIQFKGLIGQRELARRLFSYSFCLALQEYQEAFGIAVIEAKRAGVIVIASKVGAHVETITDGYDGFLIEEHYKSKECFEKVVGLAANLALDKMRREFISNNARAYKRSWEQVANELTAHWDNIFQKRTSPAKKVVVLGSYGFSNTGDEAILSAIVRQFRRKLPDVSLVAVTGDCKYTKRITPEVETVYWRDISTIVKEIKSSDLVICGGGGLFFDYWGVDPETFLTNKHWGLTYCAGPPLLAAFIGKPVMIYAVGVGPLYSEVSKKIVGLLGRVSTRITVRDYDSKEELIGLGITPDKIELTADPAFSLIEDLPSFEKRENNPPQIAVVLRNWNVNVSPAYWERAVAEALEKFAKELDAHLVFIPFQVYPQDTLANDIFVIERVSCIIGHPKKTIFYEELPLHAILNLIASSDILVGMRLHSLMFAAATETPMVSIEYDPKISNFMESIDLTDFNVNIRAVSAALLFEALINAWSQKEETRKKLRGKKDSLYRLAQKNLFIAKESLESKDCDFLKYPEDSIEWLSERLLSHTLKISELEDKLSELEGNLREKELSISLLQSEKYLLECKLNAILSSKTWRLGQMYGKLIGVESPLVKKIKKLFNSITKNADLALPSSHSLQTAKNQPKESSPFQIPSFDKNNPQEMEVNTKSDKEALPQRKRVKGVKPQVAYLTNQLLDWWGKVPKFGGGEHYCIKLGKLLQKLGFEVTFYQTAHVPFDSEYYGFRVISIPMSEHYSEFHYGVCNAFYEHSLNYDYAIYNLPEYSSGKMRNDAIMICHGIWFDHNNYGTFRTNEWFKHLFRAFSQPQKVVCNDTNAINFFRALRPDLISKMVYIPNWVDTDIFKPPEKRKPKEKLIVLFPRRAHVNRGARILEAILKNIPHNCQFIWVGEGDIEDTEIIKQLTHKDPRLKFFAANFEEMPLFYRQADICVIPTIAAEGTSLSCLESLASGCATIATNVGGLPNIILDNINGLLVDPEAVAIAKAINFLIENPQERERLQITGPEIAKRFSLKIWEERWTQFFKKLGWIEKKAEISRSSIEFIDRCGSKMKIAIVTRNANHGGVETLIELHQKYFKADVFVAGGHNQKETCPFDYIYIDGRSEENAIFKLSSYLRHYDVIEYHWIPEWAVKAVKETGKPSVEVVHRIDTAECDKNVPTLLATHSKFLAEYLYSRFDKEAIVIPNAIDVARFKVKTEAKYIGAITSYYYTKGIDIFLEAWAKIQSNFPDESVRFYGQGDNLPDFEKIADRLGLRNVVFSGPVISPEKYLTDFKLFVQPSRIEGMPIAILEALACNIPVISSDLPGMVEFNNMAISRGFNPPLILSRSEDIDDLAEKLKQFLEKPVATETRSYISQYYGAEQHCREMEKVYQHAISQAHVMKK